MIPRRLILDGFLSWRERTVVDLGPGATAILGENGAGKSSLIEAIGWSLFGKGRGRSPDDFVNAASTSARVSFEFELGGQTYRVERQRELGKAAKSYLGLFAGVGIWKAVGSDSIAETQCAIEELLGLDYDTWAKTSLIGQGDAAAFTKLTPSARKQLLGDVLGLGEYEALSERAREVRLGFDAELSKAQGAIAMLQERAAVQVDVEGAQAALEAAELEVVWANLAVQTTAELVARGQVAATAAAQLKTARDDVALAESAEQRAGEIDGEIDDERVVLQDLEARIADTERTSSRNAEEEAGAEIRERNAREQLETASERLRILEAHDDASCYACGQDLDPARRLDLIEQLRFDVAVLKNTRADAAGIRERSAADATGAAVQRDRMRQDVELRRRRLADLTRERGLVEAALETLPELRKRVSELEQDVASSPTPLGALKDRANLAKTAEANASRERERLLMAFGAAQESARAAERAATELEQLQTTAAGAREMVEILDVLRDAFGRDGIPALLIETAIPELEAEANAILGHLTAGRFTVRLETLRALKSGGDRETLDVLVADDVSDRALEQLSGGERQAVDLGLRVALARVLARRSGHQIETLILDEGFTAFDTAAQQRAIRVLHSLSQEFSCLLFITHLGGLADAFPSQLRVVRTPEGSRLEEATA